MPPASVSSAAAARGDRIPPHSEEAERGVLGSILLDAQRVLDICTESQLAVESFYLPVHRTLYEAMRQMPAQGQAVDLLTVTERLKTAGRLDEVGGAVFLQQLVDSTPTAAHAEFYIDIVRQKHLLRLIIERAREAESVCYDPDARADALLNDVEQAFLDITERQHGTMMPWPDAVKQTMQHVEVLLTAKHGLTGISTGFHNLDNKLQGLRTGEMTILAARPSMGKTSLAMNVVENVALGRGRDHTVRPVGVFSLEMSSEQLVLRMLCSHASVSAFKLVSGYADSHAAHGRLTQAAALLGKAPIYLDDQGGLDIMEVRARARRMKSRYGVELIVVDYLQLMGSRDFARQGKQAETAHVSGNLKAMAKELKIPVLVLSQLNRAPEQRTGGERAGAPKLSDLRDSGAIEQDADVVLMLRRPCKYESDPERHDAELAIVDVAKHRNGPTGEVRLNFEDEFTRFRDRAEGVDGAAEDAAPHPAATE